MRNQGVLQGGWEMRLEAQKALDHRTLCARRSADAASWARGGLNARTAGPACGKITHRPRTYLNTHNSDT